MMRKTIWVVTWLLVLLAMRSEAFAQNVVKLGSLNDLTGGTSDVGKDAYLGMREAVQYVNDTGGINGKKLEVLFYDYGYRVPEAMTTYKRFRNFDKVVAVWGWGTGDTEALTPTVNAVGAGGPRSSRLSCGDAVIPYRQLQRDVRVDGVVP